PRRGTWRTWNSRRRSITACSSFCAASRWRLAANCRGLTGQHLPDLQQKIVRGKGLGDEIVLTLHYPLPVYDISGVAAGENGPDVALHFAYFVVGIPAVFPRHYDIE